jgi:hypothetical protein
VFVKKRRIGFTEEEARQAIAASFSWAEALRKLGYAPTGGNPKTLKKYAALWQIDTTHFDPYRRVMDAIRKPARPLSEVLTSGSNYSRASLKRRLFSEGIKAPVCELCGQGELWRGQPLGLILDHINGVRNDNRLENLQIVCPNCAATLDTHCGRAKASEPTVRACRRCGKKFRAKYRSHQYCSRYCGIRQRRGGGAGTGPPRPERRKVTRPPYGQLVAEIQATSVLAVGRKYGVSDNAVRKWLRAYEGLAKLR